MASLGPAALWYVREGVAVFPLEQGGKRPGTRHGFKDATTDPGAVETWWASMPHANLGLPTGRLFDVIDVDPPHGAESLAELEAAGLVPEILGSVRTPRGGRHLYVRATGDGNRAGFRPGLDYRGVGGYVVAPPSRSAAGVWTFERPPDWEGLRVPRGAVPSFLDAVAAHFPPPMPSGPPGALVSPPGGPFGGVLGPTGGYAAAALAGELARVAEAPVGARNDALNRAAYSLGQLVAAGALDEAQVCEALEAAAIEVGLTNSEVVATIRSGLQSGMRHPRDVPAREEDLTWLFGGSPAASAPVSGIGGASGLTQAVGNSFATDASDPAGMQAAEIGRLVRERFPLIDWAALWADTTTDEWIIEPLVPARRLVALYSAPKLGKSLLMLEIAVAISRGGEVLGVRVERARRVLYVDFENDPRGDIRERLKAMGVGPADLDGLAYLSFPSLTALDSARGAAELLATVGEYGCEVVVIDTISRAVSGDENENDTWLSFYRHTGLAFKQAGITLIRLDHSGKDDAKGMRGGSAKSGDVDAVWRLTKVDGLEETYRLECEAARLPIAEKTLVLKRCLGPLRHEVDSRPGAALAKAAESRMAAAGVGLIAALDDLEIPLDWGRVKARRALDEAGIKADNNVLVWALAKRRADASTDGADGIWNA